MNVSGIVRERLAEMGCEGLRHPQLQCSCLAQDADFMQCGDCAGCLPASLGRSAAPSGDAGGHELA